MSTLHDPQAGPHTSGAEGRARTLAGDGRMAVVTGAGGFIGRHLVDGLVEHGWRVRAVDLHAPTPSVLNDRIEFRSADVREPEAMRAIFTGADTVFHLASAHLQVHAPPNWYESVNVEAMEGIVDACVVAGVRRLVHTSSVGIYGHVQEPPAGEDAPKQPQSEYERTKLEGEQVALREAARKGLDLIVLRPSWVYGPGCPRTEKLLRTVKRGRFVFIGAGENLRHPIFIGDAVEAFERAAAAPPTASGRPYLVVGPRTVTVRELVEACARVQHVSPPSLRMPRSLGVVLGSTFEAAFGLLRRDPPFSRRSLAFFDNDNAFDGSAAAEALGFCASIDLDEGLALCLGTGSALAAGRAA